MIENSVKLPQLLDASCNQLMRLHVTSASLTKNIVPISSYNCSVPQDETPTVGQYIRAFSPNGDEGIYRIISVTSNYGSNIGADVYSEHAICTLNDDYIPEAYNAENQTYLQVLTTILSKQTTVRWQIGTVAASGTVSYSVQTGTLLEACVTLIKSLHNQYMFSYDFNTSPWTLNVVACETTPSCECRLTRNLTSATITVDRSDMLTKLYLPDYGAADDGTKMSPPYSISADTVSTWGIVAGTYSDTSAEDDATLLSHAQSYLEQIKNPIIQISLDAVELSQVTGIDIDRFEVGKLCRVALPLYETTSEERIIAVDRSDIYGDVGKVTLTLANRVQDVSNSLSKLIQETSSSGSSRHGGGGSAKKQEIAETKLVQAQKSISLVITDGEINYASIVAAINEGGGSTITLNADTINLTGYVTASELSAINAKITNLTTGVTKASILNTAVMTIGAHSASGWKLFKSTDGNSYYCPATSS